MYSVRPIFNCILNHKNTISYENALFHLKYRATTLYLTSHLYSAHTNSPGEQTLYLWS